MQKIKKNKISNYMLIGIIYIIILLTISTAYSFLNEDLSINATASITQKEDNYNIEITEILKSTYDGITYYEYNVVITYLGTETTTGWEAYIQVPYTTQVNGCYNANSCTVEGEVITIINADYNANLSPSNNSASFNLQLAMEDENYTLNVLDVKFKTNISTTDPDPTPDPDPDPTPDPDPNPTPDPDPDEPSDDTDYITTTYELKNDWGTRQWYVLTIQNTSETETIESWIATFKITSSDTLTDANIWGGTYNYDEESGLLTISGPSWSPSISPTSSAEVNLQITPPAPEAISFVGTTSTGETITATIK